VAWDRKSRNIKLNFSTNFPVLIDLLNDACHINYPSHDSVPSCNNDAIRVPLNAKQLIIHSLDGRILNYFCFSAILMLPCPRITKQLMNVQIWGGGVDESQKSGSLGTAPWFASYSDHLVHQNHRTLGRYNVIFGPNSCTPWRKVEDIGGCWMHLRSSTSKHISIPRSCMALRDSCSSQVFSDMWIAMEDGASPLSNSACNFYHKVHMKTRWIKKTVLLCLSQLRIQSPTKMNLSCTFLLKSAIALFY
jgi:hypothetical protein